MNRVNDSDKLFNQITSFILPLVKNMFFFREDYNFYDMTDNFFKANTCNIRHKIDLFFQTAELQYTEVLSVA